MLVAFWPSHLAQSFTQKRGFGLCSQYTTAEVMVCHFSDQAVNAGSFHLWCSLTALLSLFLCTQRQVILYAALRRGRTSEEEEHPSKSHKSDLLLCTSTPKRKWMYSEWPNRNLIRDSGTEVRELSWDSGLWETVWYNASGFKQGFRTVVTQHQITNLQSTAILTIIETQSTQSVPFLVSEGLFSLSLELFEIILIVFNFNSSKTRIYYFSKKSWFTWGRP